MANTRKGAAKRKTTGTKSRSRSSKKTNVVPYILGLFAAVFFMYSLLSSSGGSIGKIVSNTLIFLVGKTGSFVLCFVMILTILLSLAGYKSFSKNAPLAVSIIAPLATGISMHIFDTSYKAYKLLGIELPILITEEGAKGGYLGVLLSKIFAMLISPVGTLILVICLFVLCAFLVFGGDILSSFEPKAKKDRDTKKEKLRLERHKEKIRREELQAKKVRKASLFTINIEPSEKTKASKEPAFTDIASNFAQDENASVSVLDGESKKASSFIDEELFNTLKTPASSFLESQTQEASLNRTEDAKPILTPHDNDSFVQDTSAHKEIDDSELLKFSSTVEEAQKENEKSKEKKEEYIFPPYSLLKYSKKSKDAITKSEMLANAKQLVQTLGNFQIGAKVANISLGPTITRYELTLDPGVRVSKVARLSDDIAMGLAAQSVRIEAPIPGKSAVGIEVPNKTKQMVSLREIVTDDIFSKSNNPLTLALGRKVAGEPYTLDLDKLRHVLIGGATGSGKSVCINDLILSLIYHASPEDVKMILIDPKMVELGVYNGIPHLLLPVVTDPKQAAGALNWAVKKMTERYDMFSKSKARDITGYNKKMEETGGEKLPRIVIVIDELADLMLVAAQQVEASICRLAQLARAAGIHLILATQRPSVDVITGLIKANMPSRIAFYVSSQVDSRTILDMSGAERLLSNGDMLCFPVGTSVPVRAQCSYVSDEEIAKVVSFVTTKRQAEYDEKIVEEIDALKPTQNANKMAYEHDEEFEDDMMEDAIAIARNLGSVSTSLLQRKLRIGYARAGRIVDVMAERGIVSEADGSKPRKYLGVSDKALQESEEELN